MVGKHKINQEKPQELQGALPIAIGESELQEAVEESTLKLVKGVKLTEKEAESLVAGASLEVGSASIVGTAASASVTTASALAVPAASALAVLAVPAVSALTGTALTGVGLVTGFGVYRFRGGISETNLPVTNQNDIPMPEDINDPKPEE